MTRVNRTPENGAWRAARQSRRTDVVEDRTTLSVGRLALRSGRRGAALVALGHSLHCVDELYFNTVLMMEFAATFSRRRRLYRIELVQYDAHA